ncbi:MAG: HINT domain-containing protein [Pseudomonadota bacterium]|nr:HINT domain-containing protein [Pseudomonadota bacterium]
MLSNTKKTATPVLEKASETLHPTLAGFNEPNPTDADLAERKVTYFHGDTLVHLEGDELREIRFIDVGDKVLSRCEKTGQTAYREVIKNFRHEDVPLYCLAYYVNDSQANNRVYGVGATAEHLFWVQGKSWTMTVDLQPGDVIGSRYGDLLTVKMVHAMDYNLEGYNLTVAEFHTYFVGAEGAWVHD